MDPRLSQLQTRAFADEKIRNEFLSTRNAAEPLSAFCEVAAKYGCPITLDELITLGEESCAAMLRSQNGGGENNPYGCWDDDYELFFLNLERK